MTDTSTARSSPRPLRRVDTSSEAARQRVRKRYRSERRFRSYGLAAICLTAVFVAVLLADILLRGLPSFWQHYLVLDVALNAEQIDPEEKRSPEAFRQADYFPVLRDALKTAIPGLEGREAERTLTRLLSSGAADPIIDRLNADPSLLGKVVKVPLLLSDDADLYLKGNETAVASRAGRGTATPTGSTGEITITSTEPDFAVDVAALKQTLATRALELEKEVTRLTSHRDASVSDRIAELRTEIDGLKQGVSSTDGTEQLDGRTSSVLAAINGGLVKVTGLSATSVTGDVLLPLRDTANAAPGNWQIRTYLTPESNRKSSDLEVSFLERFRALGTIDRSFNWRFLTAGDSREPELAGIRGALIGSALTLAITLVLCLPIGVLSAIYLEEFAPKNWLTDLIEININNLAAVPSIVFGLLGLAVFLNFFDFPRSAPLVGGLVLALLVLPTIIIAARAALKAVPPSIKEAALGVGASHQQAIFHHVLPLAMPGIMTGTIIGMAHALGETAPLLMIGMVAFIVDVPKSFTDASTVLPVQIYLWSDLPEKAFQSKTAAAIIVLLVFLFLMNGAAIWLRKKFERRW